MVLCLPHDGACTESFENFRETSLKGDPSNDITLNPPLFSLVNTFKYAGTELITFLLQSKQNLKVQGHQMD
jgi:hypothetical protein